MPEWITKYWLEWVFGLLIAGLTWAIKKLSTRLRKEQAENQALRDGMKSLLMRQIQIDCEAAIADGFCPVETKTAIEGMYQAYHALGGNGIITNLRDDMLGLPTVKVGGEHG